MQRAEEERGLGEEGGVSSVWGPPLTERHTHTHTDIQVRGVASPFVFGEVEGGCGGRLDGWMVHWDTVPPDPPHPTAPKKKSPSVVSIHPPVPTPPPASECSATVLSACRRAACCLPSVLLC